MSRMKHLLELFTQFLLDHPWLGAGSCFAVAFSQYTGFLGVISPYHETVDAYLRTAGFVIGICIGLLTLIPKAKQAWKGRAVKDYDSE